MKQAMNMKICILTNSHHTTDVRLYYKIARSLAKLGEVYLISTSGVRNEQINPYQMVVDTESKWFALTLLYKKAKKINPDVVICVEPLTVVTGLALRRSCRAKVVFDVHEFFADAFAERFPKPVCWAMKELYLLFERWLQSKVDATIGVSDEILDQLVSGSMRDQAVSIPNYPVRNVWDYSCEMPAELSAICELDFDLVYIGGLTRDRGVFKMLKTASLLKKEFPAFNMLILGKFFSEEMEAEFNRNLTDLNLNAIVYHQNWLPAEKIGLLLKRSKIGLWVFDPRNKRMRRALPLKVLEYFAAGLPVVSTNTPQMRDLIEKNRIGACCEFQSAAIAKAVGSLLSLPRSEYAEMSKRAKDLIDLQYNWEALEPRLLSVIEPLAK